MKADLVDRLDSVVSAAQWRDAHRLAHEIKGMAGTMGAWRLAELGAAIEALAQAAPPAVPSAAVDSLRAEWQAVEAVLAVF